MDQTESRFLNKCKERKRSLSNVFLNIIKLPEFPRYDFCFSENGLVAYQGCQLLGQSSILGKLGENTQGIETGISILANHIKKTHSHLFSTLIVIAEKKFTFIPNV